MGNNFSYDAIHSPDNNLFTEVKYQDMKEMRWMVIFTQHLEAGGSLSLPASVCLSVCLFVPMPVCLSVCLSVLPHAKLVRTITREFFFSLL